MTEDQKTVTIKEVLNKIINFDLYRLKRLRKPLIITCLISIVGICAYYGVLTVYQHLHAKHVKYEEAQALVRAQANWVHRKSCFDELDRTPLTRDNLDYFVELETCFKKRALTEHELKVHTASWSDSYSRATNYLRSPYYKLGSNPKACEHKGEYFDCN